MALPSKIIELIEQIAENLDIWAKGWGKRLLKNRPRNLRQFRQSILAEFIYWDAIKARKNTSK
jgi:hypothetical protein